MIEFDADIVPRMRHRCPIHGGHNTPECETCKFTNLVHDYQEALIRDYDEKLIREMIMGDKARRG